MNPTLQSAIDNIIANAMQSKGIPGITLAVLQNRALVYSRAYGVMSAETRVPMHINALFHHASVTKLFVATALIQLRDRGQLDLDAPVVRYLPYFQVQDPRYTQVTVRQMMTHTSGMPDTEDYAWDTPKYDDAALENYVRSIANLSLEAEPGTQYAYSNIAYEVLGDVIAKVSGVSFEEFVATNILEPLGMKTATLLYRQADLSLMATPHTHDPYPSGPLRVSPVFPYNREHAPSSTLYASVLDTSRFALAYLNGGAFDGARILSSASIAEMWTPAVQTGQRYWKEIGLTWFIGKVRGQKQVGHDGEDVGFTTTLSLVPELGLGVILLSNADDANVENDGDVILELLIEAEQDER